MLLKHGSAALVVNGSTGADLDIGGWYVERVDGDDFATAKKIPNVKPTAGGDTTVLSGVDTSTARLVKKLTISNVDASLSTVVTVTLNDGTLTVREKQVTLQPGDAIRYAAGVWYLDSVALSRTFKLGSDHSSSSVTPDSVTGLKVASVPVGTYLFDYRLIYQASAATTGVRFDVNFTGTVTQFLWDQAWMDTSATASTAVPDQDAVAAAGEVYSGFASRAKGTAGRGVTLSVDTANSDMMMDIWGIMTVSVAGDLELYHGSEVAAASVIKAGSALVLTPVG